MKRLWVLIAASSLGLALLLGTSGDASAQWRGGWRGGGWGGWHGVGWRGGWGWNRGWGGGWGWNRGWGWRGGWWPAYAGLGGFGLGLAATSPYWGSGWGYGYGWPSSSYYAYNWPYDSYYGSNYYGAYQTRPYYAYAQTAPLVTGRSVATGSIGMHCATSARTCMLRNASYIGGGCSCRVPGGRAHGSVMP